MKFLRTAFESETPLIEDFPERQLLAVHTPAFFRGYQAFRVLIIHF